MRDLSPWSAGSWPGWKAETLVRLPRFGKVPALSFDRLRTNGRERFTVRGESVVPSP